MSAKTPQDQPTRQSITALLDSLSGGPYCCRSDDVNPLYAEYKRLESEADELEKKLLDVPEVRRARAAAKVAQNKYEDHRRKIREKVTVVRRLFWARGLTPAVLKKVNDLVEEVNRL